MSDDLISRQALLDYLRKKFINVNYHPDLGDAFQCAEAEEHNEEIICMIETVQEQPTAFDVDKIVEQLEAAKYVIGVNATIDGVTSADYIEGFNDCVYGCISIVKGAIKDA